MNSMIKNNFIFKVCRQDVKGKDDAFITSNYFFPLPTVARVVSPTFLFNIDASYWRRQWFSSITRNFEKYGQCAFY